MGKKPFGRGKHILSLSLKEVYLHICRTFHKPFEHKETETSATKSGQKLILCLNCFFSCGAVALSERVCDV